MFEHLMDHRQTSSFRNALVGVMSLALSACSGQDDVSQDAPAKGASPIPRFPATGVPGVGPDTSGVPTTPGDQTGEISPDGVPTAKKHPSTTTDSSKSSVPSNTSSLPSSKETPTTSGSVTSTDASSSSQPKPEPGQATFVDWGVFRISFNDEGELEQSLKRITGAGEHQMTRLGHERLYAPQLGLVGVNIRRTYGIFDVSQVHNAIAAKLEFYVFASSAKSAGSGGYSSPDPSETVEIHALEQFTPQQILDAPFGQTFNHSLDPKIAQDLADGRLYARFELTPEFLAVDKLTPAPTATPRRSECSDEIERACGRWLTIPLTQEAVKDINESKGLWGMGWNLTSIDHVSGDQPVREFLFFGAHFDTSPSHETLLPDYIKPKPRLIFEFQNTETDTE